MHTREATSAPAMSTPEIAYVTAQRLTKSSTALTAIAPMRETRGANRVRVMPSSRKVKVSSVMPTAHA